MGLIDPTLIASQSDRSTCVPREGSVEGAYCPVSMNSETCSPIIIEGALVLARIQSCIMEASATRNPSRPCTLPYWSTTAVSSDEGPILQVAETW